MMQWEQKMGLGIVLIGFILLRLLGRAVLVGDPPAVEIVVGQCAGLFLGAAIIIKARRQMLDE